MKLKGYNQMRFSHLQMCEILHDWIYQKMNVNNGVLGVHEDKSGDFIVNLQSGALGPDGEGVADSVKSKKP